MIESVLGFVRTAVLYILGGIGGILLSCVTDPDARSVGASTADFAIIGGVLAAIIVHWHLFDSNPTMRCYLIFMVVIIVFFNLMMNIASQGEVGAPDTAGHIGGFTSGVFLGLWLTPHMRQEAKLPNSQERKCQRYGMSLSIVYYLGLIVYFYAGISFDNGRSV